MGIDQKDQKLFEKVQLQVLSEDLKVFRIVECYHAASHRMEVLAMPATSSYALVVALFAFIAKCAGGKVKNSVAPKGRLEREVQEFINAHSQQE